MTANRAVFDVPPKDRISGPVGSIRMYMLRDGIYMFARIAAR